MSKQSRVNLLEWVMLIGALYASVTQNWTATIVCLICAVYLKVPREKE